MSHPGMLQSWQMRFELIGINCLGFHIRNWNVGYIKVTRLPLFGYSRPGHYAGPWVLLRR